MEGDDGHEASQVGQTPVSMSKVCKGVVHNKWLYNGVIMSHISANGSLHLISYDGLTLERALRSQSEETRSPCLTINFWSKSSIICSY